MEHSFAFKILLFRSFHISHTIANDITYNIEHRDLAAPPKKLNWLKCHVVSRGKTVTTPGHRKMWFQTKPKKLQCKNRWAVVSDNLHPPTQIWASEARTFRRCRLSLVGRRSWNKRQTNNTTFKGTSLYQREGTNAASSTETWTFNTDGINISRLTFTIYKWRYFLHFKLVL